MPLVTQAGDLATRLARAFGIRGRIPTALDEQIVPVAIVERPDVPPFCDVPAYWRISARAVSAAATRGLVGVRCISGVALVDEIRCISSSANVLWVVQLNRQQTTNLATTDQIFTVNKQTSANVGPEVPRPAMRLVQADPAAITGLEVGELFTGNSTADDIRTPGLCLYANDELNVQVGAVNISGDVVMHGRWYPSVG